MPHWLDVALGVLATACLSGAVLCAVLAGACDLVIALRRLK